MKKLIILLLLCSCAKTQPEVSPLDGQYHLTASACSVASYLPSVQATVEIKEGTIHPLNAHCSTGHLNISGNRADLAFDPLAQSDLLDGYNSANFEGGTVQLSGQTLTVKYAFLFYQPDGSTKDHPTFTLTYQR